MDLTKTGEIYDLERFKSPRKISTESSINKGRPSLMDETALIGDAFESRNRFEQVFLASPRAQELYSSLEKTKQKPTSQKVATVKIVPDNLHRHTAQKSDTLTDPDFRRPVTQKSITYKSVPGFDEVVNMADFFHNNKTAHSSSSHSVLSDQSLMFGKPTAFDELLKDKDFEVSPFKPSLNDSAIKQKVSMVISRLEDDSTASQKSRNRKVPNAPVCRDSGFNDMQSDSGGSSEGTFTDVMNKRGRVTSMKEGTIPTNITDVNTVVGAQTVDEEQEVHISFESNSDEEIDVETEDVQVDDDDEEVVVDNHGVEEEDNNGDHDDNNNNNNLITKNTKKAGKVTVHISTTLDGEQERIRVQPKDRVLDGDIPDDVHNVTMDEAIPETPQGNVEKSRKKETNNQGKPDANRTNEMESSSSATPSDKATKKTSKINSLKQWSIKALKTRTHMGIIVEGQRSEDPEGELWHSTAIIERLSPKCVQTKSGSQYKLIGPINDKVTLQQGFPPEFVKAFKRGFPDDWVDLVSAYFNAQSSSESEDEKPTQEQLEKKNRKVPKEAKHSAVVTPTESRTKKKNNIGAFKTPENRQIPKEVEIKTTRSGRMVKPPLAWWRGQRILTDRDHNLEGIDPGAVEQTPLSSMYNVDIKLPLKSEESSSLKQRPAASGSESSDSLPRKQKNTARSNRMESSDSSSEKDNDKSLKKLLFFSPKKTPDNNHSLQERSQKKLSVNEGRGAGKIEETIVTKIVENNDSIQQSHSMSKLPLQQIEEEETSHDDLPTQVRFQKKHTSTLSVMQDNSPNSKKRKNDAKPYTDSESEVVEQTASKIPSPPKRILRSRKVKTNDLNPVSRVSSNADKLSDVDSEDSQADRRAKNNVRQNVSKRNISKTSDSDTRLSSCDERSDNTGDSAKSAKVPKATAKRRNVEKRMSLFYRRVKELAKDTSSQSSESDAGGTSLKQSKQEQAHPRSSKAAKANTESNTASKNNRRVDSSKRKGKTDSDSEKASGKKQALKVSKQTASKDGKKKKDFISEEAPWKDEEIQKLNEALYTIPGNTPMFWQKISREVGSRTAQECQFQHQGEVLVSNKKSESSVKKGSAKEKKNLVQSKAASQQKVKTVTGGVGTIKRKRELRELLEQQDVDYEDDIFDSTPFKRKKDLKLPFNLSCNSGDEEDDDDDNEDDDESETAHGTSYKTPSSRTPSSRFRPLGPLSISATPSAEFVSPSLLHQVNRKDMDHYIYRMQQGKRGTQVFGKQKSKMRTSTPKKHSSSSHLPVIGSELFEAHPASDHESEDEDKDYYFSDE